MIGADTGGTFTDFVLLGPGVFRTWKVPSTPDDFARGVLSGLGELLGGTGGGAAAGPVLVHASTVATNALLERKGARTALVTTRGFRDVLAIGWQTRPSLYDLEVRPAEPLVPEELRFEVGERVAADGAVVEPIAPGEVAEVLDRVVAAGSESLAVCLLFSFLHPDHERAIAEAARARGIPCTISSEVAPELREYERTSTTTANAFLGPGVAGYLGRLAAGVADAGVQRIRIVQSNGGSIGAELAAEQAVRTLLSGPAAGVLGAREAARQALGDDYRIVTFDMGGTSTDVSFQAGALVTASSAVVGGLPIQIPILDLHTVGAGGGSIARVDAGGALRVGPESAGADPGPACYGSGESPTVTDADLLLGRIDPERFLDGRMPIHPHRAERALAGLARGLGGGPKEAARSVVEVVNANMGRAIRVTSVRRGHDPRDAVLVSFGGAGGLHGCALADEFGMSAVLVPRNPGVLSALGAATCDVVRERGRSVLRALGGKDGADRRAAKAELERSMGELLRQVETEMTADGFGPDQIVAEPSADLRYQGQSYELTVPFTERPAELARAFHAAHKQRYGYAAPGDPVEVVTLRIRAIGRPCIPEPQPIDGGAGAEAATLARIGPTAVLDRPSLGAGAEVRGPALLVEPFATTWAPEGWAGRVDRWGHLLLRRTRA